MHRLACRGAPRRIARACRATSTLTCRLASARIARSSSRALRNRHRHRQRECSQSARQCGDRRFRALRSRLIRIRRQPVLLPSRCRRRCSTKSACREHTLSLPLSVSAKRPFYVVAFSLTCSILSTGTNGRRRRRQRARPNGQQQSCDRRRRRRCRPRLVAAAAHTVLCRRRRRCPTLAHCTFT